jgi:DNA-binding response OmpR family regulator
LLSPTTTRCNILIVDDSIDNLRFLANILTQQGYQVRKVLNGHMALTAARSAPPDLVLLDINMPQMNGYEVCQALKADPTTADIPVIFISALDDVLDRVRAYTVGGVDYIAKPFQFEEVIARVGTQLQLQALQRQAAEHRDRAQLTETAYQQLFEQMQQGAYQLHPDGSYRQVNPALATRLGYASVSAMLAKIGETPQALYVDPEGWVNLMEQLSEPAAIAASPSQVYRADGQVVEWVETLYAVRDASGQIAYYLGLVQVGA